MNSKRKNRGKYSSLRTHARIPRSNIRVSSAFESGCISVPPLEKAPFPFPLVAQEKRSIPLSIAREKMRFPFEFLHLNEARGIRSRRTKTESRIYIYIQPCFEFVRANCRSPSSRPCYSPPLDVDRFLPLFNPGDRLARWFIYFLVFRPPSTSLLLSVHRRLVVPILRPFRSISSSFCSRRLRRCRVDDDVEFRLDFDVAQEPPISGNWLRHGGLECSIQSFHFFFSMGITSSFPVCPPPPPCSLLFPSFILFIRFLPFLFFPPCLDEATVWNNSFRCHRAKRSLKGDKSWATSLRHYDFIRFTFW